MEEIRDKVFKDLDWEFLPNENKEINRENFTKTISANIVKVDHQLKKLPDGFEIWFYVNRSLEEFDHLLPKILPQSGPGRFILEFTNFVSGIFTREQYEDELTKLLLEVEEWAKQKTLEVQVKKFCKEIPDKPPTAQKAHILALAYAADFNTLLDYQQTFEKGHRLNFAPVITKDVIDRAVAIAIDRFEG